MALSKTRFTGYGKYFTKFSTTVRSQKDFEGYQIRPITDIFDWNDLKLFIAPFPYYVLDQLSLKIGHFMQRKHQGKQQ
jgi:hypothetical protein